MNPLSVVEQAELNYRELPFLVDKDALPHPFQGGDADTVLLVWGSLCVCLLALSITALRLVDRHALTQQQTTGLHRGGLWRSLPAVGILVCAAVVRLMTLGLQPADSQEVTYLLQAVHPLEYVESTWMGLWLTWLSPQMVSPHPPVYRTLLYLWSSFGDSLFWLRLPAALAGIISVWVFMTWVARALSARWVWVAGLALAFNPLHVYYSQSISPYTLATLLVLVSYLLHESAVGRGRRLGLYGLVTGLAVTTHFIAVAALVPLGILSFIQWLKVRGYVERVRFQRYLAAAIVVVTVVVFGLIGFAFYGQLVPFIFPVIDAMKLFPLADGPQLATYWSGFGEFAVHGVQSTLATPYIAIAKVIALGLLLLSLGGLMRTPRGLQSVRAALWVLPISIAFFFVVGAITISQNQFHYFASRRFVPLVPFLILVVLLGLKGLRASLGAERGWAARAGALIVMATAAASVAFQGASLVTQWTGPVKPDVVEAVELLDERLEDGDAVAVGPYGFFDFLFNFHARDRMPEWFHAGGPARWVAYGGDAERLVMLAPGDISLPWEQSLKHLGLNRIWLLEVDESPLGLRELLGPGNVTVDELEAAGAKPCAEDAVIQLNRLTLRCFENASRSGLRAPSALRVGPGDYGAIAGFSPPGQVRSKRRRLSAQSRIWLSASEDSIELEFVFDTRLERLGTLLDVTLSDGVAREARTIELRPGVGHYRVPLGALRGLKGELQISLQPHVEELDAQARCLRFRRERFKPGRPDCGIFLKRVTLNTEVGRGLQ